MAAWLGRRFAYALLTFFGITVAVFVLIRAVPGDPVTYYLMQSGRGMSAPPEVIEQIRKTHRLDRPVVIQYAHWLANLARLDLGTSFVDRRPVRDRIVEKLPNTLVLNGAALLLALLLALPAGIFGAARPGHWLDRISGVSFLLLYSLPTYWVALLLMDLLSVRLGWFPLLGANSGNYSDLSGIEKLADRIWHLILPVTTLAYGQFAFFARFARSSMREVMGSEYLVAARARGIGETRLILSHALRNALIPLVTVLGVSVPFLLSGSVIVETLFAWDGLGRMYYTAVLARDYPVVMGMTVVTAVMTLTAYLITDALYPIVDPRVRLGAREA